MPKWLFFPSGGGGFSSLAVGDTEIFESASTSYISVTRLTDTQAIVCYRDDGNSSYGTAALLSISNDTISVDDTEIFESASTSYISVTRLTDTKAIVCYRDSETGYGNAVCLSVSNDEITVGSPTVFENANTNHISVTRLTDTKAIVCYQDGGNSKYGTACCLTLSGTTITAGTPVVFRSGSTEHINVSGMTDTKAIVCYAGNNGYGTACCLTLSGTTITAGTELVFNSAAVYYNSVTSMDDSHAIVAYRDSGNSEYATALCLTLSGSTITAGTEYVFDQSSPLRPSIVSLSDTQAVVCYGDGNNSNYGTAVLLELNGTDISAVGTSVIYKSATSNYNSAAYLADGKAIVCYQDGGNSSYGTATLISAS